MSKALVPAQIAQKMHELLQHYITKFQVEKQQANLISSKNVLMLLKLKDTGVQR